MPSEFPSQSGISGIAIRPFSAEDQPFLARVAPRIEPPLDKGPGEAPGPARPPQPLSRSRRIRT